MKKILSVLAVIFCAFAANAQDKNNTEIKQPPKQWATVTNPSLKGANGLLVISLPVEVASMVCMISHTGDAKNLYTIHNSTSKEFAPGSYDVTFWGIKIPNVIVEKGKETRIFAGVLNSSVRGLWEVFTTDGQKIFASGSPKVVALPPGNYVVKIKGNDLKTTVNDGKVTMFSFTVY